MPKTEHVVMNKELQQWAFEKRKEIKKANKKIKKTKKASLGKCQICGERDSKFICLKCNRSICPLCHFKIIGICKKCIPSDIAKKWDGKNPDWEKILDLKWIG